MPQIRGPFRHLHAPLSRCGTIMSPFGGLGAAGGWWLVRPLILLLRPSDMTCVLFTVFLRKPFLRCRLTIGSWGGVRQNLNLATTRSCVSMHFL